MPKYSYDTYADMKKQSATKKERKVGYLKLQPGEEAIVRFDYDEPKEFEIVTVHEVKVQDKVRTVVCLRNAKEPIDACPLCASNTLLKARFFAKLIRYVTDDKGNITAVPQVASWQRKYADILKARFVEFGDLRNSVFKITRIGSGVETSYDIQYVNPVKYSEENGYVKDFSAFEDFDLAHHSYMEKTKEEMEEYLKTGDFPMRKKSETTGATGVGTVQSPVPEDDDMPVETQPKVDVMPNKVEVTVPVQQEEPKEQKQDGFTFNRPRRTYDIQ